LSERNVASLRYVASGDISDRQLFPREGVRLPYQPFDVTLAKAETEIAIRHHLAFIVFFIRCQTN
jgi:hypothetical protein